MRVVVCGAIHHDLVVRASRMPRLDETLAGQSVAYSFGGKGGNQAVAAARMGADVAMIGRIGTDPAASGLRAALAAAGVDHLGVLAVEGPSGMSVAILLPDGGYGAIIVSGPNRGMVPDDLVLPDGPMILLLQNEIPQHVSLAAARRARSAGGMVIFNAAPAGPIDPELLVLVDLLIVNRLEAEDLCGAPATPEALAKGLIARGAPSGIVTLGGAGLCLWDPASMVRQAAFPATVLSTHGAGDMLVGALAAALGRGMALIDAATFAQAAASLHVAAAPEARALTDRAAVERLIAAHLTG